MLLSGQQVQDLDLPEVKFWVEPLIPQGSIVIAHGKFGTSKTPILSNFAKACADRDGPDEVLGLPVKKGRVLFVQADTPKNVIVPRLKALGVAVENGMLDFFFCYPGFNAVQPNNDELDQWYYSLLYKAHRLNNYDIVFIDSLRAIHNLDSKDDMTVHQVYRALRKLFHGATIVLIHHDKKFNKDSATDETFSGSQAWANHATVTLKFSNSDRKENEVKIEHFKTQASELIPPIIVKLGKDGINILSNSASTKQEIEDFIRGCLAQNMQPGECDRRVAEYFNISERTARKRRLEWASEDLNDTEIS